MDSVAQILLGVAAVLAAITGIWKFLHLGPLLRGTRFFLDDWNGQPARPGVPPRPSFPERMANVEDRTAQLNHDFRNDIGGRMALLQAQLDAVDEATKTLRRNGGSSVADAVHAAARGVEEVKEALATNRAGIERLDDRLLHTEERISDHRRRNDEQAENLRQELERRAALLEQRLHEREAELDAKLEGISQDVFRASAARAILTELGHKIEPGDDPQILGA